MRNLLLLLIPMALIGCRAYKDVELQAINGVEVQRLDKDGIAARVNVTINNPNGFRIKVSDPDVDLYLNGTNVGKATLDSAVVLDKRSTHTYDIPLHARFEGQGSMALITIMGAVLSGETRIGAKGTVAASAFLLKKRFPFDVEERVPLND